MLLALPRQVQKLKGISDSSSHTLCAGTRVRYCAPLIRYADDDDKPTSKGVNWGLFSDTYFSETRGVCSE